MCIVYLSIRKISEVIKRIIIGCILLGFRNKLKNRQVYHRSIYIYIIEKLIYNIILLTCLLANINRTASLSSSSASIRMSSSRASPTLSRSLLSTTKMRPGNKRHFITFSQNLFIINTHAVASGNQVSYLVTQLFKGVTY